MTKCIIANNRLLLKMLYNPYIWVNYNDLTATSLETWSIIVNKGNHPQMALIQNIMIYHSCRKSSFLVDKSTISMSIFNSYLKLPEGNYGEK